MSLLKKVKILKSISPKIISTLKNTALSSFLIILFVTNQPGRNLNARS